MPDAETVLGGVVVAVEPDGTITAAETVRQDTPEAWAEAAMWIKPAGRRVTALIRTSPAATIRLSDNITDLLFAGWAEDCARTVSEGQS